MKRFLPVSIHVHGRHSRIYAKNKAGRKRYYKPEETKDLLKTGGSVFGLKDHYQRFKNFFSLLKNTVVGHGGRRVKDKTKLSKNRKIGAQLAEAAYSKKAPQNFRVYRRERNGHYTIFRQDTKHDNRSATLSPTGEQDLPAEKPCPGQNNLVLKSTSFPAIIRMPSSPWRDTR